MNIHERVRRQLAKAEKAKADAATKIDGRKMAALLRRDMADERMIDGLMNGTREPRNARELAIFNRLDL